MKTDEKNKRNMRKKVVVKAVNLSQNDKNGRMFFEIKHFYKNILIQK